LTTTQTSTTPQSSTFRGVVLPFIVFTLIWSSTWIVIRDQLGPVHPLWSVTYRFIIAAAAMAVVARWNGESLRLGKSGIAAAAMIGLLQFCVNFNGVYLAEQHITSGVVATFFALLLIPNTLLAWALLGHKPDGRFVLGSAVSIVGVGLLFTHELRENGFGGGETLLGLGLTLAAMLGASGANVYQARPHLKRFPFYALLAWAMAIGAVIDGTLALLFAGPPTIEWRIGYWVGMLYLALAASALAFSLYFPVVRRIGPAKAAYSSAIVPIIALGFSTWLEGYRWTWLGIAGVTLAVGGMLVALSRSRSVVPAPDAA
jgi:drug/metabolite transporter (DMT)-like permease